MEILIDIDAEKAKAATDAERQQFLANLFLAAAKVTGDYRGTVDFSDPLHWVITVPDDYVPLARELLAGRQPDPDEEQRLHFLRHLEDASAVVATWPEWKRNVLRPWTRRLG